MVRKRRPRALKYIRKEKEYVREYLKKVLSKQTEIDWIDVVCLDDEVYCKYYMAYAIAIMRRRIHGELKKSRTIALIRFNVRDYHISAIVPLDVEAIDALYEKIKEAYDMLIKIEELEKVEAKKKRMEKLLRRLSPEEREILKKVLEEGEE